MLKLKQFLETEIYLGNSVKQYNSKMFSYIYSEINNFYIFDLIQSFILLKEAKIYLKFAAKKKKSFLFITTQQKTSHLIAEEAQKCQSFYMNFYWIEGMLTNWLTFRKQILYSHQLENKKVMTRADLLAKKKLKHFQKHLIGIKNMFELPDIVIIINPTSEISIINECKKLKIPTISILDSNCNPNLINIPIPGNTNCLKSIRLILNSLSNSIMEGKESK